MVFFKAAMIKVILVVSFVSVVTCDVRLVKLPVVEEGTLPPPPKPYAFGYAAGRFPGHIDRTHSEVSDGSGVIHGSYSYVDPRNQIRTVEYVADEGGFHPILNKNPPALPKESAAVAAARDKHLLLYSAIANAHDQARNNFVLVPADSVAVEKAKAKHFDLYQKIAEDHARIAAEREAERKSLGEPSEVSENEQKYY